MDPNNEILRTVCVALGRPVIILETIWHHTLSLKGLKIIEKLPKILSSLLVFVCSCTFLNGPFLLPCVHPGVKNRPSLFIANRF